MVDYECDFTRTEGKENTSNLLETETKSSLCMETCRTGNEVVFAQHMPDR